MKRTHTETFMTTTEQLGRLAAGHDLMAARAETWPERVYHERRAREYRERQRAELVREAVGAGAAEGVGMAGAAGTVLSAESRAILAELHAVTREPLPPSLVEYIQSEPYSLALVLPGSAGAGRGRSRSRSRLPVRFLSFLRQVGKDMLAIAVVLALAVVWVYWFAVLAVGGVVLGAAWLGWSLVTGWREGRRRGEGERWRL